MEVSRAFKVAFNAADVKQILIDHLRAKFDSGSGNNPYPTGSQERGVSIRITEGTGVTLEWSEEYET